MKKKLFVFLFFINFIFAFLIFTYAYANDVPDNQNEQHVSVLVITPGDNCAQEKAVKTFELPELLTIIGDEAFEGTSIVNIDLPEKVTTIGERAFANIQTLRIFRIPIATNNIARSAFIGSNNVMIMAAQDSYARSWAKENGIPFLPLTVMCAGTGGQNITGSLVTALKEVLDTESIETQNTNRAWRKFEEIQAHETIKIIANVIQSRAPPVA